jgi:hypothetical protein
MGELAHCHVAFRLDIRSGHFLHRSLFLIGVDERENTAMWLFAWIFVALHFYTVVVFEHGRSLHSSVPFPKQASPKQPNRHRRPATSNKRKPQA